MEIDISNIHLHLKMMMMVWGYPEFICLSN